MVGLRPEGPRLMAGNVRIQVDGLRELQRDLRALGGDAVKELRKVNLEGAQVVERAAVPHVPVRTGRLRRSVKARASQRGATVKAGTKTVPYAAVIEFGSPKRHMRPRPFLFPTAEQERPKVVALYRRRLNDLIHKHFR